MNPWPDDYTSPPTEQEARRAWGHECPGDRELDVLGWYLHHLTEELRGVQAVCDEQAAELARRDVNGGGGE